MLLCLYRHPTVAPDAPRLGVVRGDDVVDVNLACLTSMASHMRPKRAADIANALAPSDLLSFLEGGRHSWTALAESLVRLGRTLDVGIRGPDGEDIVIPKSAVRLVPIVPPAAGWSSQALGTWDTMPVPSPGAETIVALHTDGQAYLPEYHAIMGASVADASPEEALASVSMVAVVRPSRAESSCLMYRLPSVPDDEPDVIDTVVRAVVAASRARTVYVGDVVRCGPSMLRRTIDLREPAVTVDLAAAENDIVPSV